MNPGSLGRGKTCIGLLFRLSKLQAFPPGPVCSPYVSRGGLWVSHNLPSGPCRLILCDGLGHIEPAQQSGTTEHHHVIHASTHPPNACCPFAYPSAQQKGPGNLRYPKASSSRLRFVFSPSKQVCPGEQKALDEHDLNCEPEGQYPLRHRKHANL